MTNDAGTLAAALYAATDDVLKEHPDLAPWRPETRDVDSLFVPHGIVLEEARNVARDLGLPTWWLNEQASVYISGKDDPGKRRVFDHPGLRVTAASLRHIFAMRPLAAVPRCR